MAPSCPTPWTILSRSPPVGGVPLRPEGHAELMPSSYRAPHHHAPPASVRPTQSASVEPSGLDRGGQRSDGARPKVRGACSAARSAESCSKGSDLERGWERLGDPNCKICKLFWQVLKSFKETSLDKGISAFQSKLLLHRGTRYGCNDQTAQTMTELFHALACAQTSLMSKSG